MTVYVVRDDDALKIGYTGIDIRARLSQLQVASSRELSLVKVIAAGATVERELHRDLSEHRIRGEWFTDCQPVRDAINKAFRAAVIKVLLEAARYALASFEIAVAYLHRGEEELAAAEIERAARFLEFTAGRLSGRKPESKEGQEA